MRFKRQVIIYPGQGEVRESHHAPPLVTWLLEERQAHRASKGRMGLPSPLRTLGASISTPVNAGCQRSDGATIEKFPLKSL